MFEDETYLKKMRTYYRPSTSQILGYHSGKFIIIITMRIFIRKPRGSYDKAVEKRTEAEMLG